MTNAETHNIDLAYARACDGHCVDCGATPDECIAAPCPYHQQVTVDVFTPRRNPHHLLGKRFTDCDGITWELVGYNDLFVPYWSKVVHGKVQSTRFTVADGDSKIREWM